MLLHGLPRQQAPGASISPELRAALEGWISKIDDSAECEKAVKVILPLLEAEVLAEPALLPVFEGRDLFIGQASPAVIGPWTALGSTTPKCFRTITAQTQHSNVN